MNTVSSDDSEMISEGKITTEPRLPSTAGMTTKVVKGSLWTLAGQIAPLAVSLVTTPFVIRMLGSEGYGVLILVGLIPTYLGFADFGMGIASTKFASEAYAAGNREKEGRVVRTAALIACLLSFPIGAVLFIFSGSVIELFKVPEHLRVEASLALKFMSVTLVMNFLSGIFNTPQLTRLRMDLNALINAGFRILGLIVVPLVLFFIGGIAIATFALMVVSIVMLAGHLLVSGRLLDELFQLSIDKTAAPRMLKFGGALAGAGVASLLLINVEKVVVAHLGSASTLAHYSVAFTLASMMTMFSAAMAQSVIPAFSQLQGSHNREQFDMLYARGIRLMLIWLIPALVFLSLVAKPFFTLWAGEEFGRESVTPFYVLLAGLILYILAYLPSSAIYAAGRSDLIAKVYWAELIVYIAIVFLLTSWLGIIGAALAWSLRATIDAIVLFNLAKRVAGVAFPLRQAAAFLPAGVIMTVPVLMNFYFGELNWLLVVSALLCGGLYAFAVWKFVLRREEIDWITRKLFGFATR